MVSRKAGAIINLSSMAGLIPTPMLAVYSGTKSFIDFFSKSLAAEYKSQGINVLSVTPGLVVSQMSKIRKASLLVATPEHIASRSINRLGAEVELSPYLIHDLTNKVFSSLPTPFSTNFLRGENIKTNKRAIAKKSR